MSKSYLTSVVPDDPTKVVSTKLTAQEHDMLFEECNKRGCTFKEFLREACLRAMDVKLESSMQTLKENFENQNICRPGKSLIWYGGAKTMEIGFDTNEWIKNVAKLEANLNKANYKVTTQNQKIKEFYRFVPQSELSKRKFGEIILES